MFRRRASAYRRGFRSFGEQGQPPRLPNSQQRKQEEETRSLGRTQRPQCRFAQWAGLPPRMGTDSIFVFPPLTQSSREAVALASGFRRPLGWSFCAASRERRGAESVPMSSCPHVFLSRGERAGRPAVGPYQSPFPNRCRGTVAPSDSLNEKGGDRFSCPRPFVCGSLSLRRSACGGRASALRQRTAYPSRVRAPHYSSSASC